MVWFGNSSIGSGHTHPTYRGEHVPLHQQDRAEFYRRQREMERSRRSGGGGSSGGSSGGSGGGGGGGHHEEEDRNGGSVSPLNVHGLGKVTAGSLTVGTIVAGAVIGAYIVPSVVGVFVQNKFLGFENRLSNAQLAGRSAALGALMGVPLAAMLGIGVAVAG